MKTFVWLGQNTWIIDDNGVNHLQYVITETESGQELVFGLAALITVNKVDKDTSIMIVELLPVNIISKH